MGNDWLTARMAQRQHGRYLRGRGRPNQYTSFDRANMLIIHAAQQALACEDRILAYEAPQVREESFARNSTRRRTRSAGISHSASPGAGRRGGEPETLA
jgi:hypothetical protein